MEYGIHYGILRNPNMNAVDHKCLKMFITVYLKFHCSVHSFIHQTKTPFGDEGVCRRAGCYRHRKIARPTATCSGQVLLFTPFFCYNIGIPEISWWGISNGPAFEYWHSKSEDVIRVISVVKNQCG